MEGAPPLLAGAFQKVPIMFVRHVHASIVADHVCHLITVPADGKVIVQLALS